MTPILRTTALGVALLLTAVTAHGVGVTTFTHHFNDPDTDLGPWRLIPEANVRQWSLAEHPGLLTLWQNGAGQDIKGVLAEPIRLVDAPPPWEFQLALVQNYMAMLGVGSPNQMNYALGLNVAVTFSDPNTWPADRAQRPSDTHDFQLLAVHLGSTGEFGPGLPQYTRDMHPETFLLWGRGDLATNVCGDWKIPYRQTGTGPKVGGPASPQLYFRCQVLGPTTLRIGFKDEERQDFLERTIDCSRFGNITGIWEIGPIFSCDDWIPRDLCPHLPVQRGAYDVLNGSSSDDQYQARWLRLATPQPEPPDPVFEFSVDYCAFLPGAPAPLESLSDDFDIPGYMGNLRGVQIPLADTWTHPGHLAITLLGPSQGAWWGPNGAYEMNYADYPPPWEIEICFTAPDDRVPWNLYLIMLPYNRNGKWVAWRPGVQNLPDQGGVRYVDSPFRRSLFDVHYPPQRLDCPVQLGFDPAPPSDVLAAKPLYWLIQVLDRNHVRMGFRGAPGEPWHFSQPCDLSAYLGGDVVKFGTHCWGTVTGRHFNLPAGSPMYQQLLIDYVHYRYGTTENGGGS